MSMIAQTYDSLSLIQPFLLPAEQILQEACRRSLHWDDDLADSSELGMHWQKWLHALPQLESISIERSFTLLDKEIFGFELHTFSDTSISGYGICVYIRVCYHDRTVKCGCVIGKSRVAPIKAASVPRLELTAAVLAAKTTNFNVNELDLKFSKVLLWTDSTVVLRYLRNESTRFTTFVANRLEILHSLTAVEQWHYAPSNRNPADVASRGVWPDKLDTCNTWFCGPSFLCDDTCEWPKQPSFLPDLSCSDPEVRKAGQCFAQAQNLSRNVLHRLFTRYSNFHGLLRTVVWLLRYKKYLYHKV